MCDHVHMCPRVPPKCSIAHTIGFLEGESAIRINRKLLGIRKMTGWSITTCFLELPYG